MDRCHERHAVRHQRPRDGIGKNMAATVVVALFVLATPGWGADWLAPAADQKVRAPWVDDIVVQLRQDPYRHVFMNALGNSPEAVIVRYLNHAALALETGDKSLAQSYVDRTITMFDTGVRRGYYSPTDVELITKLIRARADAAIKGEKPAAGAQIETRWTGYTHKEPLGLTQEGSRIGLEHSD